jgi:preprotein translocase subunit YajC
MSLLSDALMFFAQAASTPPAAGAGASQGGALSNIFGMLPIFLLMGGFWFIFIAPQRKKQKELEKQIASLQTGDEILTTGGIYGTITNVKEDRFIVRVSDSTKIELGKGFVATVVKSSDAEKK